MITTLFFLQLIGFQLWYLSSKQVKPSQSSPVYIAGILKNKSPFRILGAVLILLAIALFVAKWGWMTGICAGLIGLMGTGCLMVILHPFHYLQEKDVIMLYIVFVLLEFFI